MRAPLRPTGLDSGLLPSRQQAVRRFAGLALLGCSVWLVSVVTLAQAVIGLFR